jgi:predicted nucleic acid-binding protein
VDENLARAGAALAALYRRSLSGIGDVDYLLAATAAENDAALLTTNVKHFPMLPR